MQPIHCPKTINSGNRRIKFIIHRGTVTRLRSHHCQVLPSFTTLPHPTLYQARNQALVGQSKDTRVMGYRGKYTTSPKVAIVDLKCSPLRNSPDKGRHLQAYLEYLQDRLQTIQSIGQHHPPLLHTTETFPAQLPDLPLSSQQKDFSRQRKCAGLMWQRF
jgi:hypothetical protein